MKPFCLLALALGSAIPLAGCRGDSNEADAKPPPIIAPELRSNQLAEAPSSFLGVAADDPIHWQNWSPEVLKRAADARRLLFVLVGSARYVGCTETLDLLNSNPAIVRKLNDEFVPVLVDLDLNRETGLIAYHFSPETGLPVAFPFLILLSPEGSPVTWRPMPFTNENAILDFLDNSVEVITRLWDESPDYVTRDSAEKLAIRREFLAPPDLAVTSVEERKKIYADAIRRINSFYDEDVSTMAGSGGLFPVGLLDCLTVAQSDPTLSPAARSSSRETLVGFAGAVTHSAMVDPLDGGIYPARRGASWQLPVPRRDCVTQARVTRSFSRMHRLNVVPESLRIAVDATRFAETAFRTPDGLFSLTGKPGLAPGSEWLWTIDQVSSTLNAEEFAVWKAMSELSSLGNLPSEANTSGRYFRLNSLAHRQALADVARTTGFEPEAAEDLLESGRRKLLKARESRFPAPAPDPRPSALASFRMVSAYASLFTATGDERWRSKAVELGQACRNHFARSRFLNERPDAKPEGMSDGRAFTYTIAAQAALDLGSVTLDEAWYLWAEDLLTLLGEHFVTADRHLVEVRPESRVVDLDLQDRAMVFDSSTAGMLRLALSRVRALGLDTPPQLAPWGESLPNVTAAPVVYTDTLLAMIHDWHHTRLDIGPNAPAELRTAALTLPLDLFERRAAADAGASVRATLEDGSVRELSQVSDLQALTVGP